MNSQEHIHPIFERLLSREDRERRLGQHGHAFWFTGLSGSGKSTIAIALERKLHALGYQVYVLDGDNIRSGINKNLTFSEEDRLENVRRIAEVSKLFVQAGVITLNCFITPTQAMRDQAKEIIGRQDFSEVYIDTPLEVCEARDVKGLYKKARAGEIKNFTGIDAPFEIPVHPDVTIATRERSVRSCVEELLHFILPTIRLT